MKRAYVVVALMAASLAIVGYVFITQSTPVSPEYRVPQDFWTPIWPSFLGIPAYQLPPLVVARHSTRPAVHHAAPDSKPSPTPAPSPAPSPSPPAPSPSPYLVTPTSAPPHSNLLPNQTKLPSVSHMSRERGAKAVVAQSVVNDAFRNVNPKVQSTFGGNATASDAIPVLGISVFVNADLLVRLLDSVDYPVQKVVIIQNGLHPGVADVLRRYKKEHPDWTIECHPENLGCAGAWNRILAAAPQAPYHIITNDDIRFYPGALQRFHHGVQQHVASVAAGQSNKVILYPSHGSLMASSPPWSCFAILKHAVDVVGRFDENFWPVYHEDYDYMVRMARAGLWQTLIPQAVVQHGWATDKYEPGMERASQDQGKVAVLEEYKLQQQRHERGSPYYALKWGVGETPGIYNAMEGYWNKSCTNQAGELRCRPLPNMLYSHPFNDQSLPLSFSVFDPALRRCLQTGVGVPCRYNASLLPHPHLVPHDVYDPRSRQWKRK
eukprot:GGOE01019045.1.p1 GENE.GGOE01019045.1~~GGOE01019045.1.p1  ORF type:complete len:493 (+),score=37.86 GGOE01019045.1:49-1527(+)